MILQLGWMLWRASAHSAAPSAAISLSALNTPATENFDTLAAAGTSAVVPNGWAFAETGANANTTYTAGTGSGNAGDTYSFGAANSSERAFGGLRSSNLVPAIGASFTNNTGAAISALSVAYTGEEWRLGTAARTDQLDFQYSLTATAINTGGAGVWTDVNALDFVTPNTAATGAKDGNAAANRTAVAAAITNLNIPNGATFFIRWTDAAASGSNDGLAIDDFSITASGTGAASPSPSASPSVSPSVLPSVSPSVSPSASPSVSPSVSPSASPTPAPLGSVILAQNWSDTALIESDDDWSGVPNIVGYRGDNLTNAVGTDPQTILIDGGATPIDVNANLTDPNAFTSGGIGEFELGDPAVAFQGSGTADAPHLVVSLNTGGVSQINVAYSLRDIDGSMDNAAQPVALQYRVGNAGNYTNIPAAFVADATTGPNAATLVSAVSAALPAAAENQPLVQLRIITANAVGNDEFVGVDDIVVTGTTGGPINLGAVGAANPNRLAPGATALLTVNVTPGNSPSVSTGIQVIGNLPAVGGAAQQPFYDDGTNGDQIAGDNVFSYSITVPANQTAGGYSLPISVSDAQNRTANASIALTVTSAGGTATGGAAEHLALGNPSNAVADVNQPFNYLLDKTQYAVGYHRDRAIPNWVSWHLDSTWLGSATRQNDFREDPTLPAGWYRAQSTDYSGSGFDRGHHTPSGDRTKSTADNSATFLMTNMMPQAPGNNQGPWERLESFSRSLVSEGNELYVVGAGTGTGGTGDNGFTSTIAGGKIAVPSYTYKVIVVLPVGDNDLSRVTTATRTIAVIMPNTTSIRPDPWQKYLTTIDQVEALTGYDFFSNVPVNIQNAIESRLDAASSTATQTVAGGSYADLNVNQTSDTPSKTLGGNVTVTGTLSLGNTVLNTGGFCVTLGPNAVVARTVGYISGCLTRQLNSTATPTRGFGGLIAGSSAAAPSAETVEYPVGTENGYSPVTATITGAANAPSLTVRAVQGSQPNVPNPALALKRYWTLDKTGDITANLTFKYLDLDVPATAGESSFRLQRYETGAFTEVPAVIDANANTATATGISQFSDWTLLAALAPTAADISISGRVITPQSLETTGALVTLTDLRGAARTVRTRKNGEFQFTAVAAGGTYILTVSSRHHTYAVQIVTAMENLSGLIFMPQ